MSDAKSELAANWERDDEMRREILRIQHGEAMALHADFEARQTRNNANIEASTEDHIAVIRQRAEMINAMNDQTAILKRIAEALERRGP